MKEITIQLTDSEVESMKNVFVYFKKLDESPLSLESEIDLGHIYKDVIVFDSVLKRANEGLRK